MHSVDAGSVLRDPRPLRLLRRLRTYRPLKNELSYKGSGLVVQRPRVQATPSTLTVFVFDSLLAFSFLAMLVNSYAVCLRSAEIVTCYFYFNFLFMPLFLGDNGNY